MDQFFKEFGGTMVMMMVGVFFIGLCMLLLRASTGDVTVKEDGTVKEVDDLVDNPYLNK